MITTDKAIERLAFTITKQNKPNQTDLDSLKVIAEFIESSKKNEIKNNYLFGKLYVWSFMNDVIHLNDSLSNNYSFAQKTIGRILQTPLIDSIKMCMDKLNEQEFWIFCKSIGFNNSTLIVRNEEQIKFDDDLKTKYESEFLKYGLGVHEYEDFEEKIKDQVVFFINKYKYLP